MVTFSSALIACTAARTFQVVKLQQTNINESLSKIHIKSLKTKQKSWAISPKQLWVN